MSTKHLETFNLIPTQKLHMNRNQVNCIRFSDKMNLFSDNTDELQYLTEELNHESQENGIESKAKLKKITLS